MKWFSISGIAQEIKRIRWPKKEELLKDFVIVLSFAFFFGIFFIGFDFIVGLFLRLLGLGG
ncbi:MAG: preprotein translocase subunit SecE [Erysipelotrichaceae bacterium]